jgi:hypothetical protein
MAWRMQISRSGILALILLCSVTELFSQTKTSAGLELLDARGWDFSKRFALRGSWTFFENRLIAPEEVLHQKFPSHVLFPSLWNDHNIDRKGLGFATYGLSVIVPDSLKRLSFEIPQLYSSYKLWVNGDLVASAGTTGTTKEAVVPQWIYQKVEFDNDEDTLRIVLHIANFSHYKGGAKDPIYLGTPDVISSHFNWAVGSSVSGAFILLVAGLMFLIIYRQKKRPVILYFSLLCMTWACRSLFSNLYPLVLVLPEMNWDFLVKIEYLTLFLTAIWASLFFNYLFKDISNFIFTYLPVTLNVFFIVFAVLTPPLIFTQWLSLYLGLEVLVILFCASLIIRSLIMDREGSWFLIASLTVGILVFAYDLAAYQSSFPYNVVFLNIGYVTMFILTALALLFHVNMLKSKNVKKEYLTYDDLFKSRKK